MAKTPWHEKSLDEFLKDAIGGLGRTFLGKHLDALRDKMPKWAGGESIFGKKREEKEGEREENLTNALTSLTDKIDQLIDRLAGFSGPFIRKGPSNLFQPQNIGSTEGLPAGPRSEVPGHQELANLIKIFRFVEQEKGGVQRPFSPLSQTEKEEKYTTRKEESPQSKKAPEPPLVGGIELVQGSSGKELNDLLRGLQVGIEVPPPTIIGQRTAKQTPLSSLGHPEIATQRQEGIPGIENILPPTISTGGEAHPIINQESAQSQPQIAEKNQQPLESLLKRVIETKLKQILEALRSLAHAGGADISKEGTSQPSVIGKPRTDADKKKLDVLEEVGSTEQLGRTIEQTIGKEKEGGALRSLLEKVLGGKGLKKITEAFRGSSKAPASAGTVATRTAPVVAEGMGAGATAATAGVEGTVAATGTVAAEGGVSLLGAEGGLAAAGVAAAPETAGLSLIVTAFAMAASGVTLFAEEIAKGVQAIRGWTKEALQANMQFAEFSGAMAAVQAQLEIQSVTLAQIHGAARATSTSQLAEAQFKTETHLAPFTDAISNIKTDMLTAIHGAMEEGGFNEFVGKIGGMLDNMRLSLRHIAFWVDWDKAERENPNRMARQRMQDLFFNTEADFNWISGGRRGRRPGT